MSKVWIQDQVASVHEASVVPFLQAFVRTINGQTRYAALDWLKNNQVPHSQMLQFQRCYADWPTWQDEVKVRLKSRKWSDVVKCHDTLI